MAKKTAETKKTKEEILTIVEEVLKELPIALGLKSLIKDKIEERI